MTPGTEAARDDVLIVDGVVAEVHKGGLFAIDVAIGGHTRRVQARLSGKMVLGRIRVVPGDRVRVEVSSYDPSRGRITYRHR
jgi:translation initiation factor IF-1